MVQKRWKLIFWGLTAAAVALLAPGLVLTLEPALFLGLGVGVYFQRRHVGTVSIGVYFEEGT